jgi:uncharacterized protein YjbI with pentapeptide repeats
MTVEIEKDSPPIPETSVAGAASPELAEILEQHREWLVSNGHIGKQADLSGVSLEGADLTNASLRGAFLDRSILKGADLFLADFQGASLRQADLRDTGLLGTKLQDANLLGAKLDGATGLQCEQLAGANIFGATLPAPIASFEGPKYVGAIATRAGWFLAATLVLNGLAWLRILTVTDLQLLTNAPSLPLPGLRTVSPMLQCFLFWPVLIAGLYVCLHLYLQHLWERTASLPAILLDGQRLDACMPWFARWPVRRNFKWLRQKEPPLARLETAISMFFLYWIAPITIFLFWGRYLTVQDLRGTMLHVFLLVAVSAAAMHFTVAAGKSFATDSPDASHSNGPFSLRSSLIRASTPLACGFILYLFSTGAILGAPHHNSRMPGSATWGIQTWAANTLWMVGYSPYAQLNESEISTKPSHWTDRDDEVAAVGGANLNRASLRHVQAYGAFFGKAHLWQADLQSAYLSGADLREATLRQATLQSAVLDQARLNGANLQEADLQKSNLTRADLRDANLSHASMEEAMLPDAKLDGAILYAANLHNALLQRASLQRADLRVANLEDANLTMDNFRDAYLSSAKMARARLQQADFTQAILTEADLRGADLSKSSFQGAVVRDANFAGSNLQNADLRSSLGLTAQQICSAANISEIQLDDALKSEVDTQCGAHH